MLFDCTIYEFNWCWPEAIAQQIAIIDSSITLESLLLFDLVSNNLQESTHNSSVC